MSLEQRRNGTAMQLQGYLRYLGNEAYLLRYLLVGKGKTLSVTMWAEVGLPLLSLAHGYRGRPADEHAQKPLKSTSTRARPWQRGDKGVEAGQASKCSFIM